MSAVELKNEGNKLFKEGHIPAAWEKYDEASKLDNSSPVYLSNRAQCELKMEQYGSAIESCTEALKIDPNFVKCYFRRAIAYGSILKYNESVRDFQKVMQLQPDFAEGRVKLQSALSLKRYTAFQLAIKVDDEPSILDQIDLSHMPENDGPSSVIDLDLDNLTDESISSVIKHFTDDKRLSKRTVFDIVIRVNKILREEATMPEVTVPEGDNGLITVCGDTHGQFYDVLHIFEKNGFPSKEHTYVFNGDFVDRGSWSTEVIILLYLLKLKNPKNVMLNRGNHETDAMNVAYGFSGECKAKYTEKVFKAFSESFSSLPLGALIEKAYMVVHGGLFSKENVTIEDIQKIDRFATKQPRNEGLMMEMLWSDPQEKNGLSASKRGIAHMFGPDITKKFLELNNLRAIIRSHEVRDGGYEIEHDGKLVTVFSAPNYCDQVGNKGAYINIGKDLELNYEQFEASWHPKIPPMAYASGLMR